MTNPPSSAPAGDPSRSAYTESQVRRVLGPFSATSIVIGAIIGVGIFFTPADVARATGSESVAMATWMVGGVIAMAGALTFAELGGMYTRSGGQYAILRDALSAPVGFCYVFCNATIIQAGAIAIIGWLAAVNLGVTVTGVIPSTTITLVMAGLLIVGFTLANVIGVKTGAAIQNTTVVIRVATLLVIALVAMFAGAPPEVEFRPEVAEQLAATKSLSLPALVFAGLVPVFFSLGGWQHALWIGGEIRDPERNIPRAICIGVGIVTLAYLLANWGYFRLLGHSGVANSKALAAEAVATVLPDLGKRLVAAAIAVSAAGVLNAQLLSGPRLILGMAEDGKFFRVFSVISARWGTPIWAILFLGGLGLGILFGFGDDERIGQLLNCVVLVDSVFFLLTGLSLFVLRRRHRHRKTWRSPAYPLFPVLFVIGEVLVISGAFMSPQLRSGAWLGVVWIAVALGVYALCFSGERGSVPETQS